MVFSHPKKIIFCVPRFHTNLVSSVAALKKRGHSVKILSAYVGTTENHFSDQPLTLPQSPFSRLLIKIFGEGGGDKPNFFPSSANTLRFLIREKPDIVIVRNPRRIGAIFFIFFGWLLRTKIIIYTQSDFSLWPALKLAILDLMLLVLGFSWYSTISSDFKIKRYGKRLFFVPFAVEKHKEISLRFNNRILMVGKFEAARKRHEFFLDIIIDLLKNFSFEVWIVGEVSSRRGSERFQCLREIIANAGHVEEVRLIKNVAPGSMVEFYSNCDFLVLPSVEEPAAIAPIEALSNGIPAICSDACGTQCYIQKGVNGFVFKADDREELFRVLESLLGNKALMLQLKKNCREFSEATPESFLKHLNILCEKSWGFSI